MVQDNKNIFQKAWESGPVQGFFNYPEYLRDEGIQRVMEANEAFNEKGFLGGLGHVSREYASDIVGFPSAIVGLPNELAEWLDPATETQIGSMVESAYENHRQTYGKDPSMAEKYDIMQNVQNQVSPWLTETVPIAGMDVTKRGLIGLPVAGAAFAAEVAVTGGTAAIAKGLAKKGVRESVEKAPQTLAKQFAEGTKDVARETTRQALLIPKRIDDVVASTLKYTVGKPLQYSAKLTLAGGKKGFDISKAGLYAIPGGKYAADVLWSRATGKAAERNLASEKSTREKFREAGKRQFGTEWKDDWSNIEDDLDVKFSRLDKVMVQKEDWDKPYKATIQRINKNDTYDVEMDPKGDYRIPGQWIKNVLVENIFPISNPQSGGRKKRKTRKRRRGITDIIFIIVAKTSIFLVL